MSRQDKATTDKHARTLRELIKKPENKVCADCKRNDPRWASWNIGVFLCIRCSGIHRGMGTHISKVKSVDLDAWTPEQMKSIQIWGNHRANLYWEAHLKAGHIPPDHKMESFIRSKYESRRWAMDGPPPFDPSVLENGSGTTPVAQESEQEVPSRANRLPTSSVSTRRPTSPVSHSPVATRQPQGRQLLSARHITQEARPSATAQPFGTAQPPVQPAAAPLQQQQNDLFSLDFHTPTSGVLANSDAQSSQSKKDVKQDILSLFSAPPATTQAPFGQFAAAPHQTSSPWAQVGTNQQPGQITSMMGNNGTGAWGASSGWKGAAVPPAQGNLWSTTQQSQPNPMFGTNDLWGLAPASSTVHGANGDLFGAPSPAKKDDVFGDLWK